MPNWRDPSDYAFIEKSRSDLIAWQFLRRNRDYQYDYYWFITLWNKLEAQYGAPPNRNFDAWKNDPRAYRSEHEIYISPEQRTSNQTEACISHDDNLLIECWMGTKWGFYKFPVDPKIDNPVIGKDLTWRTIPVSVELITGDSISEISQDNLKNKIAVLFDLGKDLKQQINSAKLQLIVAQKNNSNLSLIKNNWILYLRLVDAIDENVNEHDIQNILNIKPQLFTNIKVQAINYVQNQYLDIINLI